MNKVLIVIDAQHDFTFGALRNEEAIEALPVIQEAVEVAAKKFKNPIFYTKDTHDRDYLKTQEGKHLPIEHCIIGTDGWELCPEVDTHECETMVFLKGSFGCPDWDEIPFLENADEILICGFCTDICVSANFQIIKAFYPEVPITIISDGCAGSTPELHYAALKVMKSCQARIADWATIKNEIRSIWK